MSFWLDLWVTHVYTLSARTNTHKIVCCLHIQKNMKKPSTIYNITNGNIIYIHTYYVYRYRYVFIHLYMDFSSIRFL